MQGSNNGSRREAGPAGAAADQEVREQDQYMPIANVIRIMRRILPAHAKISDDAKETIQECVSEYISFITGEANDRCQREQRKTITAEDVIWAMSKLGFDDYVEPLTLFLSRHRTDSNSDDMLLHHATRLHHRPPPAHAYAHPLPPLPPNGGAGGYMDQYHLHGQPGNFGYPASQEHQYPAALMHPRGGGGGNTGASSSRGNEGNGFDPYGRFNN